MIKPGDIMTVMIDNVWLWSTPMLNASKAPVAKVTKHDIVFVLSTVNGTMVIVNGCIGYVQSLVLWPLR